MKAFGLALFAAGGAGLLLCGCGSSTSSGGSATSPLAGNWLIVGPMPTDQASITPGQTNTTPGLRLAMTFDVNGKNIVAGGFGSNFCDNVASSFEFGSVVTGTVAADVDVPETIR